MGGIVKYKPVCDLIMCAVCGDAIFTRTLLKLDHVSKLIAADSKFNYEKY